MTAHLLIYVTTNVEVALPRNSRTFYLQICLFAVTKSIPKFSICGLLAMAPLAYLQL